MIPTTFYAYTKDSASLVIRRYSDPTANKNWDKIRAWLVDSGMGYAASNDEIILYNVKDKLVYLLAWG
jgi:hypothetical protein